MITTMKITKSKPEMKYIYTFRYMYLWYPESHSDNYENFTRLHEIASIM